LKAKVVFKGLDPTNMAFLGPNNILVLEKNSRNVLRILDCHLIKNRSIFNVATQSKWDLLGPVISKQSTTFFFIILYMVENLESHWVAILQISISERPIDKLVGLLNLHLMHLILFSESNHNGGKVIIRPDNNVYTVIGI
jgi:hypothetical protein